jgi:hypothetical protein
LARANFKAAEICQDMGIEDRSREYRQAADTARKGYQSQSAFKDIPDFGADDGRRFDRLVPWMLWIDMI